MTKEVLVSITGLQFDLNEEEAVEVISVGEYYYRNGKHYIIYEDMLIEGAQEAGLTKNTIKIGDNFVEIMKKGAGSVHMMFEKGKKNVTCYSTPFGELLLGLYTTHMQFTESEQEMVLNLEYALDMNGNHVSDCDITIKVTAR